MTQAIKEYLASQKWRPIEEAPKDGSRVIVLVGEKHTVARWEGNMLTREGLQTGWFIYGVSDKWWNKVIPSKNIVMRLEDNPTHFRPIPDDKLAEVCEVLLEYIVNEVYWAESKEAMRVLKKAEQIIGGE